MVRAASGNDAIVTGGTSHRCALQRCHCLKKYLIIDMGDEAKVRRSFRERGGSSLLSNSAISRESKSGLRAPRSEVATGVSEICSDEMREVTWYIVARRSMIIFLWNSLCATLYNQTLRQKDRARFHEEWKGERNHGNHKRTKKKSSKSTKHLHKGNDGDAMSVPKFLVVKSEAIQFARAAFWASRKLPLSFAGSEVAIRAKDAMVAGWHQNSFRNSSAEFRKSNSCFSNGALLRERRDGRVVSRCRRTSCATSCPHTRALRERKRKL